MATKYIAFKMNIPEEYRDREDVFMAAIMRAIAAGQRTVTLNPRPGEYETKTLTTFIIGEYEFMDPIKGM